MLKDTLKDGLCLPLLTDLLLERGLHILDEYRESLNLNPIGRGTRFGSCAGLRWALPRTVLAIRGSVSRL